MKAEMVCRPTKETLSAEEKNNLVAYLRTL